jgi:hypothetical protein
MLLASLPTTTRRITTPRHSVTVYSTYSRLPPISAGRLLHVQTEDAPCRGDRDTLKNGIWWLVFPLNLMILYWFFWWCFRWAVSTKNSVLYWIYSILILILENELKDNLPKYEPNRYLIKADAIIITDKIRWLNVPMSRQFYLGNLKGRDHLGDQDIDGTVIIKLILNRRVATWTGLTGSRYDSREMMNPKINKDAAPSRWGNMFQCFWWTCYLFLQYQTLVPIYQTTWCQVQEDTNMRSHRRGNTKSHTVMFLQFI